MDWLQMSTIKCLCKTRFTTMIYNPLEVLERTSSVRVGVLVNTPQGSISGITVNCHQHLSGNCFCDWWHALSGGSTDDGDGSRDDPRRFQIHINCRNRPQQSFGPVAGDKQLGENRRYSRGIREFIYFDRLTRSGIYFSCRS